MTTLSKKSHRMLRETGFHDSETTKLALEFFVRFSYFEHSLVEALYLDVKPDKKAWCEIEGEWIRFDVGWDAFEKDAVKLAPKMVGEVCAKYESFVKYDPPSLLITDDGLKQIRWGFPAGEKGSLSNRPDTAFEFPNPNSFRQLSVLLRRIRNNLFHGSKNRDFRSNTQKRLNEALSILEDFEIILAALQGRR